MVNIIKTAIIAAGLTIILFLAIPPGLCIDFMFGYLVLSVANYLFVISEGSQWFILLVSMLILPVFIVIFIDILQIDI